ncbi:MAG: glycosyltransferase [Cyanobacteria bacterium RI_101]|jgi:glycosyltransferase involved in cell wall biosynthesis|nr:glycosyltransferase [Cyanobacteria bacterium RI_101]
MPAPVSVVIPCYCCGQTIERAVQSVVEQTLPPGEIILVNDASADDTPKILDALSQKYGAELIKVVNLTENQGAGGARNQGRRLARFPYIAFLDADDAWHPQKLEIQYAWMIAHPEVSLCGHRIAVTQGQRIPGAFIDPENIVGRLVQRRELLISCKVLTSSWLFKNEAVPYYQEITRYSEDYFLILKTFFQNRPIGLLDETLAFFFKPEFSSAGLSGNLWAMEREQLRAFYLLWGQGYLSILELALLWFWSLIKYIRRLGIAARRSAFSRG